MLATCPSKMVPLALTDQRLEESKQVAKGKDGRDRHGEANADEELGEAVSKCHPRLALLCHTHDRPNADSTSEKLGHWQPTDKLVGEGLSGNDTTPKNGGSHGVVLAHGVYVFDPAHDSGPQSAPRARVVFMIKSKQKKANSRS